MEARLFTKVEIEPVDTEIHYGSELVLFGSCFSEYIGDRFEKAGFDVITNPFGITYNPISMVPGIELILSGHQITKDDLIERQGVFHHWLFHSSFSSTSPDESLEQMNQSLISAHSALSKATHIVFTYGTSWLYQLNQDHTVVNNCHKFPSRTFTKRKATAEEMNIGMLEVMSRIQNINSSVQFVHTLSPVRHWKDGALENSVSKAALRLLADNLSASDNSHYFPSYEIMMDELRDYRFYSDDLLHPSLFSQDLIWKRFQTWVMSENTRNVIKQVEDLERMKRHRPRFEGSNEDENFRLKLDREEIRISQILNKIKK